MPGMLEINQFSITIHDRQSGSTADSITEIEGVVPLVSVPFELRLDGVERNGADHTADPNLLVLQTSLQAAHLNWSFDAKLFWLLSLTFDSEPSQWKEFLLRVKNNLSLSDSSEIKIDNHRWDIISTLNAALQNSEGHQFEKIFPMIERTVVNLSQKYFNSTILHDLLEILYFQIEMDHKNESSQIIKTVSSDVSHFSSSDPYPPYLYLQIPTRDLEYFVNNSIQPSVEVKGYEISFVSLEVIGNNHLIINLEEKSNNWILAVELTPEIRNQSIHLKVDHIETSGLNVLTKVVFTLFKGLLIRQIENRPIDIDPIYKTFKAKFENQFQFVELMQGHQLFLKNLDFQKENVSVLIYFEPEEVA